MADYQSMLSYIVKSYRFQHTMEDARKSLEKKLLDRYSIKFVNPEIHNRLIPYSGVHPLSGGSMNNWSNTLSLQDIDYNAMAKHIALSKIYNPSKKLSTTPYFPALINLNTMNPQYLVPSIKLHEYKHILANDTPFSLAYIFGQKRYQQMRKNGDFDPLDDSYSIWALSYDIKNWMNGIYKPRGLRCLIENKTKSMTRLDKMNSFIGDLHYKLDTLENENNINYVDTPIEDDILDLYDCMLRDMDDLP